MSLYKRENFYECECGRTFEKHQSLNSHFSRCMVHRKGVEPAKRNNGGGWNKGLTKETSEFVLKNSISLKGKGGRVWTEDEKSLHSLIMKGKSGGLREGSNRWKGIFIEKNGEKIWLDSSYEYRFVSMLDLYEITWTKNYNKFKYTFNDNERNYVPDFFLSELDLWVETKGMVKDEDASKWTFFPYKLSIVKKKDLQIFETKETKDEVVQYLLSIIWDKKV